jgi:NADH-quinone oxidoreductase subunit J
MKPMRRRSLRTGVAGVRRLRRSAARVVSIACVLALAFAFAGRADAQPAAGSGAGSGSGPLRIDVQPGQRVDVPVRPGAGQPGGPGGPPIVLRQPGQPGAAPPVTLRPGQPGQPMPGAAGAAEPGAYTPPTHGDIHTGTAKQKPLLALAFWLFALITVGGALFVITRRNLIAAVMGMVGTFFGVAAAYMMLYASFLAVVQMLVYAGAIMVLFVFVIMILNRPEDEPWGPVGVFGKGLAGIGLAYLAFRLVALLWNVTPSPGAGPAPAAIEDRIGASKDVVTYPWGSTKALGNELFTDYVFPFEAVSILLLVAVVGAIAIARPLPDDEGEPPAEGQA